ncbi:hypothetical protein HDV00_002949 [Rhizophlyctis rosea]|nr:hypothetical protein HDV00_002949 [Rhizophlyctis rosea]
MGLTQLLMRMVWASDSAPKAAGAGEGHSADRRPALESPPESPSGRLSEDEEGFPTPPTPLVQAADLSTNSRSEPQTPLPTNLQRHVSAASIESSDIPEPIVPPDTSTIEEVEAEVGGPVTGSAALIDSEAEHPPLLWESVAYAISSLATTARISLRAAALVAETALEGAKYGTTLSMGIGRSALVGALLTARTVHGRVRGVPGPVGLILDAPASGGSHESQSGPSNAEQGNGVVAVAEADSRPEHLALFHNALERYTNMGIHMVNDGFTLAELFTLSTFHLTSKTVQFSFNAATETVGIIDGLFGSTETSRALAAFVYFLRRELNEWNGGQGALPGSGVLGKTWGTIVLFGGLSKALTAFACLQYMTQKRTLEGRKITNIYEGLVPYDHTQNGHPTSHPNANGDDVVLRWSEEESSALLVEIEEMKRNDAKGKGKAIEEDANSLIADARAFRNGLETLGDAHSFIKEARSIREGVETVDDADSLIGDARSVRSFLTETGSLHTAFGSEYGGDIMEEEEENEEFMRSLAADYSVGRPGSPLRVEMEHEEVGDVVPMEVEEVEGGDEDVDESTVRGEQVDTTASTWSGDSTTSSTTGASPNTNVLKRLAKTLSPARKRKERPATEQEQSPTVDRKPSFGGAIGNAFKGWVGGRRASKTDEGNAQSEERDVDRMEVDTQEEVIPVSSTSVEGGPSSMLRRKSDSQVDLYGGPQTVNEPRKKTSMGSIRTTRSSLVLKLDKISTEHQMADGSSYRKSSLRLNQMQVKSFEEAFANAGEEQFLSQIPKSPTRRASMTSSYRLSMTPLRPSILPTLNGPGPLTPINPTSQDLVPSPPPPTEHHWPFPSLIANLDRYIRFATGAYGRHFMRAIGVGRLLDVVSQDPHHPANHYAFSIHTKIPLQSILLSSYTNQDPVFNSAKMQPLGHFVVLDHDAKAVAITLRGTLGLSDALTDLAVEYEMWEWGGKVYRVHKGMMRAAKVLARQEGSVFRTVRKALEEHPEYGIVLGLSERIIGKTLGFAKGEGGEGGRGAGWFGGSSGNGSGVGEGGGGDEERKEADKEDEEWYWSLICHLRSNMRAERLYPPGTAYWIRSVQTSATDRETGREKHTYHATLARCEDVMDMFAEPRFTSKMLTDHTPGRYERAIGVLRKGMEV